MSLKSRLAVILAAAFPPSRPEDPPTTWRGALAALDHEAEMLILHSRSSFPLHDTLKEISDRMSQ